MPIQSFENNDRHNLLWPTAPWVWLCVVGHADRSGIAVHSCNAELTRAMIDCDGARCASRTWQTAWYKYNELIGSRAACSSQTGRSPSPNSIDEECDIARQGNKAQGNDVLHAEGNDHQAGSQKPGCVVELHDEIVDTGWRMLANPATVAKLAATSHHRHHSTEQEMPASLSIGHAARATTRWRAAQVIRRASCVDAGGTQQSTAPNRAGPKWKAPECCRQTLRRSYRM